MRRGEYDRESRLQVCYDCGASLGFPYVRDAQGVVRVELCVHCGVKRLRKQVQEEERL